MSKRRLCIGLLVAAGPLILLALLIAQVCDRSSLLFYLVRTRPHELPTELIRPAFRHVTRQDLPEKADDLRAIFQGGRGAHIFVKFSTDSGGIAYIERTFTRPHASFEPINRDELKQMTALGLSVFPLLSSWQDGLGSSLFDPKSIESARELKYPRGLHILIDDEHGAVYIDAHHD